MAEELQLLRSGEDSRKNWVQINRQSQWLKKHKGEIDSLAKAVAELRGKYREVGGGSTVEIYRLRVSQVLDDTIQGVVLDGDFKDTVLVVAKPFRLRRTPFDGKTVGGVSYTYTSAINRVARLGTVVEGEEIIPRFNLGFDEIHVVHAEGITGLPGVDYFDLNTDGRAWARI